MVAFTICYDFGAQENKVTVSIVAAAAKSLQLCLSLCKPMDYSPPGSSVHGILQARILVWVAITSSRGSSSPRDQTCVSDTYLSWQAGSLPLAPPGELTLDYFPYSEITVSCPAFCSCLFSTIRAEGFLKTEYIIEFLLIVENHVTISFDDDIKSKHLISM